MTNCPKCGKFLSRRDNLLRHIKSVHDHNRVAEENSSVKHAVALKNGNETSGRKMSDFDDNEHNDDVMDQSQNIDRAFRRETNNFDQMSGSDDNKSYYKGDSKFHNARETIKTKHNALKRMIGNMDIEEGEHFEKAPKRAKLNRATKKKMKEITIEKSLVLMIVNMNIIMMMIWINFKTLRIIMVTAVKIKVATTLTPVTMIATAMETITAVKMKIATMMIPVPTIATAMETITAVKMKIATMLIPVPTIATKMETVTAAKMIKILNHQKEESIGMTLINL